MVREMHQSLLPDTIGSPYIYQRQMEPPLCRWISIRGIPLTTSVRINLSDKAEPDSTIFAGERWSSMDPASEMGSHQRADLELPTEPIRLPR